MTTKEQAERRQDTRNAWNDLLAAFGEHKARAIESFVTAVGNEDRLTFAKLAASAGDSRAALAGSGDPWAVTPPDGLPVVLPTGAKCKDGTDASGWRFCGTYYVSPKNGLVYCEPRAIDRSTLPRVTPEMLDAQRQSWARGEMAMGSDADEARERAKAGADAGGKDDDQMCGICGGDGVSFVRLKSGAGFAWCVDCGCMRVTVDGVDCAWRKHRNWERARPSTPEPASEGDCGSADRAYSDGER